MGWKIYFWIFTLSIITATCLSMAESLGIILPESGDPSESEVWTWWDWASLPNLGISLAGTFGYAYKKTIGGRAFWKIFFVFLVIVDIIDTFHEYNIGTFNPEGIWRPEITFSILIGLTIPYYLALYLYGYRSETLWNPPQSTPPQ